MLNEFWHRPFDQADCYYQVGDQKTYNRNTAVAWANGDVEKIHLYWMDDVWSSIDLAKRPSRSWQDLMAERCFQIRDKCSDMGVAFSGGYDSQTIMDYFIANNITVDHIQINHKNWSTHPEYHSALDTAKKIKNQHYPNLKIDVIEVDLNYMLNIYKDPEWLWSSSTSSELRFTKGARASLVNNNYQHSKMLLQDRRLTVEGHEKPRMLIENGWWVMAFHDGTLASTVNSKFEHFYISRDLPDLHLQQLWMMIDWLESQPFDSIPEVESFFHKTQKSADNYINQQWNLAIGRNMVRHFNSWDLISMHKHVHAGGMYSVDTNDLLNRHAFIKNSKEFKNWHSTVLDFYKTYTNSFVSNDGQTQFGTVLPELYFEGVNFALNKNIWTKKYPIKPVEPGKNKTKLFFSEPV